MRSRGQGGSSLIVVLFVVAFLSLVVPSLLGLTFTGARTGSSVIHDRNSRYAATSGLEAAVQHGRTARWVGRLGLVCPTMRFTIDAALVAVTCTSTTGAFDLDRTLIYQAAVSGTPLARTTVIFRDGTAGVGEPAVDVLSWKTIVSE